MPWLLQPPLGGIACWLETVPPTLQQALLPRGHVTPWQAPVLPTLQCIWTPCGSFVHWQETLSWTSQPVLSPHGEAAPRQVPVLPMPQRVQMPRGGIILAGLIVQFILPCCHLVAMSLIGLFGQCFLPRGRCLLSPFFNHCCAQAAFVLVPQVGKSSFMLLLL
jgi:hypothetical protein